MFSMTVWGWLVLGCWLVFLGYWVISAIGANKSAPWSWSRELGLRLAIVLAILVLLRVPGLGRFLRSVGRHGALPGVGGGILGFALCVIGTGSAIWARAYLGRNWGLPMSVKENPELVTAGPYAYVRHPIYAGLWLALLGSGIAQSAWWLVALLFAGAYFFYSARTEEKTMLKRFPEEYRAYLKRTKMFVPFVL
jgi:protein-S-isoprenylcysteine O-methyltransferase Ste14